MSPEEFSSLFQLLEYFSTEQICLDYLSEQRWQDGVICPHCDHDKIYLLQGANKRYKCTACRKQFTAKAGLIFEDSKISLRKWFAAIYLVLSHKKGISSYQLARDIGVTQKTGWFMAMRIRNAIKQGTFETQLNGIVESDETFVGGKNKNRHKDKRVKNSQGRAYKDKTPVHGLIQRGGELRAFVVPNTKMETLVPLIVENVEFGSRLMTDEWYSPLLNYQHEIVKHGSGQYVNGDCHTNTLEGFWGLFKRQVVGTHHHVTPRHLQRYVDESVFRYNTKGFSDGYRALTILAKNEGSLKYKQLIYGKDIKKEAV